MDYDFSSAKKAFSRIGFALILFFAVTFAAQIVFEAVGVFLFPDFIKSGLTSRAAIIISSVTMYLIGMPVFYLCIKGLDTFEGNVAKCPIETFGAAIAISFTLTFVGNQLGGALADFISNRFGVSLVAESIELVSKLSVVDAIVFSVIIGPFFEELMFRKLIIDRTRGYGEKLSVIFSAIMFAFFHMSVQQFFYTLLIGLLYGYLYIRKGKLLYCWLLHASFNFFGAVVPLIFTKYVPEYEKFATIDQSSKEFEELYKIVEEHVIAYGIVSWYSIAIMGMSFVGLYFLTKRIRTMRFESAVFELPKDSEATTAFVNFGVISFIALALCWPFINVALSSLI